MQTDPTPDPQQGQDAEYDELDDDFDSDDEDPNVFRIRNPLSPPQAKIYTTRQLHTLIHEGTIDLNPVYQRDVVWPETKQVNLIDSIFRNFYIPPVVFAVQLDDEGETVRICVDGKQRLTSIQRFFDGQIPHKDMKTKKQFWYTTSESSRTTRNEVPDFWKRQFSEKQITCVEYHTITPGAERDIFQRVQMGMPLTAAEKLQSISSPWAEWISELESRHVSVEGGLTHVLQWDTRRGRDFQNIAHLVYCCDGLPNEVLPSAVKIEKWLSREDNPPEQFKQDIEELLKDFWKIASSKKYNEGFSRFAQRLAPVEFYFCGVLLYLLRKESLEVRGSAIYQLRSSVRQEFKDIRNNGSVGKALWRYINALRVNPTSPYLFHPEESGSKRKRKSSGRGGEDEEYRPEPVRGLGTKAPKTRARARG